MLNRRGVVVLALLALFTLAMMASSKADTENFGGENVSSYSTNASAARSDRAAGRVLHRTERVGAASRYADGIGPKPRRWCGWWMQHHTGVTSGNTGINLNVAFNWRTIGSPGDGSSGNILVGGSQRSHVSQILERLGGGCYLTISGNAGRANGGVNQMRECGGTTRRL